MTATTLEKVGVITFEFVDNPVLMKVHVFKTSDFTGVPTETEGMSCPITIVTGGFSVLSASLL